MSEMVERVARALHEDEEPPSDHWSPQWDDLREKYVDGKPSHCKEYWRRKARAAIEAMREPTEAMVLSAAKELAEEGQWDRLGELPREYLRVDARVVYDAMIDKALK